ncbi:phage tail protein [Endozoicomonas sp. SM1973]|uniref:Phage tail protein n=1 Tax=Spartinivicinus marinus TaxID=2994442 RepID=A0A853I4D4_9GAMM|nr:phage tail protein [Spartinivicinus marinus]MCX4026613.1 phage tail protein [Spartinivicinus marinus]NYZ64447.1 phage tail protein [Spartinivicinus marinus]
MEKNKYYSILTKTGQAQLTNTAALGSKLKLQTIKIGDGGDDNGKETSPKESDIQLIRERWSGHINDLYVNPENQNWLVIEATIPDDDGGFYITEFGVYDDQNNLIAIGKYPKTYKPNITEGSGSSLFLRVMLQVSNASQVDMKVDPAIMLASKRYVDDILNRHVVEAHNNPIPVQLFLLGKPEILKISEKNITDKAITMTDYSIPSGAKAFIANISTFNDYNGMYGADDHCVHSFGRNNVHSDRFWTASNYTPAPWDIVSPLNDVLITHEGQNGTDWRYGHCHGSHIIPLTKKGLMKAKLNMGTTENLMHHIVMQIFGYFK